MTLEGKTILVTGATSGIGLATSARLVGDGAIVVAIGRNREKLREMEGEWGQQCLPVEFDLSLTDEFPRLLKQLPKLHGAVLSAGIVKNNPIKFFDKTTFDETLNINFVSPVTLTVALINGGRLERGSSIVFLSSIDGTSVGIKGTLAYASSKAALTGAAKVFALELSSKDMRFNCVAPGMVATEMVANAKELSSEMIQADMAKYPLGKRYASPGEVANVIGFLLSAESSFMTGQTLTVDGGFGLQ